MRSRESARDAHRCSRCITTFLLADSQGPQSELGSSMTNSTMFIPTSSTRLAMLVVPFQVLLGWSTNTINIYVLSRPRLLRASACAHYFLAIAIITFAVICIGPFVQFVHFWYPLRTSIPVVGCPLFAYLSFYLPFEIITLLVLASWDRYCVSSTSADTRAWSSIRNARIAIITSAVVLAIAVSPYMALWHENVDRGVVGCAQDMTFVLQLMTIAQAIIFHGLCPLTMLVFGLLTIRNIRKQRCRLQRTFRIVLHPSHQRRTEGELCRMLLLQVSIHMLLHLPATVIYTCLIMRPTLQTPTFRLAVHAFQLLYQCTYVINTITYLASGQIYRREFQLVLSRVRRTCCSFFYRHEHRVAVESRVSSLRTYV